MKILNNADPKVDHFGIPNNISTKYICHLFLLFGYYLRANYALILKNFF